VNQREQLLRRMLVAAADAHAVADRGTRRFIDMQSQEFRQPRAALSRSMAQEIEGDAGVGQQKKDCHPGAGRRRAAVLTQQIDDKDPSDQQMQAG
jgi:hypothetical protein